MCYELCTFLNILILVIAVAEISKISRSLFIALLCTRHARHDTHTKYFSSNMNLRLLCSVFLTLNLLKTAIDTSR